MPLLIYRQALDVEAPDLIEQVQKLLEENQWDGSWMDSMYDFHHYHSTAHEVLAICGGQAEVRLRRRLRDHQDDLGGRRRSSSRRASPTSGSTAGGAFVVVGAYPQGQGYDMCYGEEGERPKTDENIARVPLPKADPVYGPDGPLMHYWGI